MGICAPPFTYVGAGNEEPDAGNWESSEKKMEARDTGEVCKPSVNVTGHFRIGVPKEYGPRRCVAKMSLK